MYTYRGSVRRREDGKTGRRENGKTGRREGGKTGRREDGKTEREVRRRAQAGANALRAVGGVMADQRNLKKIKRQVREHFWDTDMPVRNGNSGNELQQQRRQVC